MGLIEKANSASVSMSSTNVTNVASTPDESVKDDCDVPKRRQSEEISHRMSRLSTKSKKISDHKQVSEPPKRRQCSEIAELTSQLNKKLNPTHFTKEVHLKPSDPGYGKPQEGTQTAARGKKAHENISSEIVEMSEIIWEHGQMTGQIICYTNFLSIKIGKIQETLMEILPAFFSRICSAFTIRFLAM